MKNLIYFLREFPDKWILFTLCIFIGALYLHSPTDFSSQLFNSVVSALIGLLIGRSRNETNNTTHIDTDTVQTPSISNDEMNNTTVNISKEEDVVSN